MVGYDFLLLIAISCLIPLLIFLSIKYIFGDREIYKKEFIKFEVVLALALIILLFFERILRVFLPINIVLEIIVIMFCEVIVLKNNMKTVFLTSLGAELILGISQFMIKFLFIKDFRLNVNTFGINIINIIVILTVLVLFMAIFYKQFDKVVKKMLADNKEKYFKIINIFITVVIVAANLICYSITGEQKSEILFILNLAITVIYCAFGLVVVNMFNKYEKGMQELKYQCYYNKTLNYLMKDLRRFKHDYNNMLAVMGGFLQLEKYDELNKYYNNLAKNIKYSDIDSNISMVRIKNAGILGLLLYKLNLSKDKGVKFMIEVDVEVERMDIKINEFCEILGVLLDNAIESAAETEAKIVKLEVSQKANYNIFLIRNSVKKKIDVKKIYEHGYSTKGKNRGIGLAVVYELIKKSKDMYLDSECNDREFIQKLILHCENLTRAGNNSSTAIGD